MEFDAFSAGVEPGGLRSTREIGILICYMLDQFGKPISREDLIDSIQENGIANYFEVSSAVSELIRLGNLSSDGNEVAITKNGEAFPLADMGKGSIQLFLKILQLAILCPVPSAHDWFWDSYPSEEANELDAFRKDFKRGLERYEMIADKKFDNTLCKKLVIIEEPEQNLHPALQSKLADLFIEVSKLGVNVLVETHSEYLIRRSQVLVAEAKYKDEQELAEKCPFKVYYLPEIGKGKPYDLEYIPTGGFKKTFGEGFFDEAGKLDLIVLRNESSLKRR